MMHLVLMLAQLFVLDAKICSTVEERTTVEIIIEERQIFSVLSVFPLPWDCLQCVEQEQARAGSNCTDPSFSWSLRGNCQKIARIYCSQFCLETLEAAKDFKKGRPAPLPSVSPATTPAEETRTLLPIGPSLLSGQAVAVRGKWFLLDTSDFFTHELPGTPLRFVAVDLPPGTGLEMNSTTGVISGFPTEHDAAVRQPLRVQVTAWDDAIHARTAPAVVAIHVADLTRAVGEKVKLDVFSDVYTITSDWEVVEVRSPPEAGVELDAKQWWIQGQVRQAGLEQPQPLEFRVTARHRDNSTQMASISHYLHVTPEFEFYEGARQAAGFECVFALSTPEPVYTRVQVPVLEPHPFLVPITAACERCWGGQQAHADCPHWSQPVCIQMVSASCASVCLDSLETADNLFRAWPTSGGIAPWQVPPPLPTLAPSPAITVQPTTAPPTSCEEACLWEYQTFDCVKSGCSDMELDARAASYYMCHEGCRPLVPAPLAVVVEDNPDQVEKCCPDRTAPCLACQGGITVEDWCAVEGHARMPGCGPAAGQWIRLPTTTLLAPPTTTLLAPPTTTLLAPPDLLPDSAPTPVPVPVPNPVPARLLSPSAPAARPVVGRFSHQWPRSRSASTSGPWQYSRPSTPLTRILGFSSPLHASISPRKRFP